MESTGLLGFQLLYFIEYSAHTSIMCNLIMQPFLGHCLGNPNPFLRYLPSIVHRHNFVIISFVKKSALYLIKYGTYFLLVFKANVFVMPYSFF
jgi:hypothetical protein